MKRKLVMFRFNMVEVALALVILAIGLSSVMVLFPVGLKASRGSVAENNLADIAERVGSYLQSRYVGAWKADGDFPSSITDIGEFAAEPGNSVPDDPSEFTTKANDMDGLFTSSSHPGYYIYRQYSDAAGSGTGDNDRAVDFEAMIRVGWDTDTLKNEYYPKIDSGTYESLSSYSRTTSGGGADSALTNGNLPTGSGIGTAVLNKCYRTLIIEISWPADAPWAKREKRIYRMEIFNENFVPYPQTTP